MSAMDVCLPVSQLKVEDPPTTRLPLLDTSEILQIIPPPPPSSTNTVFVPVSAATQNGVFIPANQNGPNSPEDFTMQTSEIDGTVDMDTGSYATSAPQFALANCGLDGNLQVANAKILSSKDGMRITLLTCTPGLCACNVGKVCFFMHSRPFCDKTLGGVPIYVEYYHERAKESQAHPLYSAFSQIFG